MIIIVVAVLAPATIVLGMQREGEREKREKREGERGRGEGERVLRVFTYFIFSGCFRIYLSIKEESAKRHGIAKRT